MLHCESHHIDSSNAMEDRCLKPAFAEKTQSVPALERGLSILESLSKSKHGLTLTQLTAELDLPKSSVHCLLLTFERRGYLYRDERSGRYRLGLRICDLAGAALGGQALRDQAIPYLSKLRESTQLTCHMAVFEQDEVVLIQKAEPLGSRVNTWIGKRMDIHCTAVGKAVAAYLPSDTVEVLVRRRGMLRHNDNTIASLRKLKDELERVRRLGYSIDDEEEEIGIRCIGVPILDEENRALAAISLSGTTSQINDLSVDLLIAELKTKAAEIGRLNRLRRDKQDKI
jgi:DNA-binding IclR family transcriptional regulator